MEEEMEEVKLQFGEDEKNHDASSSDRHEKSTETTNNDEKNAESHEKEVKSMEEVGSLMNHNRFKRDSTRSNDNRSIRKELAKDWGANSKGHCSYRVLHGPDRAQFYFVNGLIVIPIAIYQIFIATDLYHRVSPALFIIPLPLSLFVLAFFYCAAFSDPGIVPRNAKWKEINQQEESNEALGSAKQKLRETKRTFVINGIEYSTKFCTICNVYQPLRSHHCRVCNCCIEGFDHHCPWIGNCVGKLNYRYFLLFIWTVTVLLCLILSFSLTEFSLLMKARREGRPINVVWDFTANSAGPVREIISGILALYTFFVLLSLVVLVGFHAILITKGMKTYEHIRKRFEEKGNPFDRGCLTNWNAMFCPPYYQSYVREKVKRTLKESKISNV
eukprot:TRINITY_DN8026_c0_g1_i1.p1 TRINITY_DN8026_c0_g1~~TRINITY_DN8026_c0_g1_i1.p1  ORF type:complete len:387 (+),score=109.88 TRINITY_DN8026_c0_g1_i1:65-1225(+)